MKSLELLEELNKILIDSKKKTEIASQMVVKCDKERSDIEHDILNTYYYMSAKDKRIKLEEFFNVLVERHERKYKYRELEILKTLVDLKGLESALNDTIYKLRKLNQEIESPIYHKRAKKNKGEIVVVEKVEK